MIDKVKLSIKIDPYENKIKFNKKLYEINEDRVNSETGEIYNFHVHRYKNNNIYYQYSHNTGKLSIRGRLINEHYNKNKIYNYDDYMIPKIEIVYYDEIIERSDDYLAANARYDRDDNLIYPERFVTTTYDDYFLSYGMEEVLNSINNNIRKLFNLNLDIRDFNVENIEICFNTWLESDLVSEYIKLMNLIQLQKKDKRYINYCDKKKLDISTSFYIKSKAQYRDNKKTSYVVNFYDKKNQLINNSEKYKVTQEELDLSDKLLRLEVQLYYEALRDIRNKYKLENKFIDFLNIELCFTILKDKYEYFLGKYNLDFYSYHKAKDRIESSEKITKKEKKLLLKNIRERVQYGKKHSKPTIKKYNDLMGKIGIHYFFIPTKWNIDYMKNPLKLLIQKLDYQEEIFELVKTSDDERVWHKYIDTIYHSK